MARVYDRHLSCGCALSSDGGGGLSPCWGALSDEDPEAVKIHNEAWDAWKNSEDYLLFEEETRRNNGD